MADAGFLSTISVVVGQTLPFSWAKIAAPASLPQMSQGVSDIIFINNLSACTFRVTLDATGRSFTLPAGVPTSAIPVAWGGSNDTSCHLFVENIGTQSTPNQVHFDYFPAGQPIIYVAASSLAGVGSVSLTNVTTGLLTFPSPDTWTVQEDISGNLILTDTTTGQSIMLGRDGSLEWEASSIGAGTPTVLGITPAGATVNNNWVLLYNGATGNLQLFDVTAGHSVMTFNRSSGNVSVDSGNFGVIAGPVSEVGGQATTGAFGVAPLIQETSVPVLVSATGATNILTFTPPANGIYRVSGYIEFRGTVGSLLSYSVNYTDDIGAATKFFTYSGGGATSPLLVNGGNSFGPPISMPLCDMTFFAKTSGSITFTYNDPSGVPNDLVWAFVERKL